MGTRQRRRLNASRNTGFVSTVSAIALIVEKPILMSFAQYGIKPQRIRSRVRCPSFGLWRTIGKLSVGATFQLGGRFGVGYSGGTRNAILISLTSPSSLALPHIALPCFERVEAVSASYGLVMMLAQIAPGDLDVTIVGQLPPSQLPLDCKLETGALEVEGF